MASSKDYLTYVLELLREVNNITVKKMMGEYIIYLNNVIIGGVYDNRFLLKNVKSLSNYKFKEIIPYTNAKTMLLVDIEDPEEIKEIVELVYNDLVK